MQSDAEKSSYVYDVKKNQENPFKDDSLILKVNNAGTNHQQLDFADISSEIWEPLVDLNIKAGLYMIKYWSKT